MSRAKLDLWVGVFVLIGIGAVLFLSLRVASMAGGGFSDSYRVKAVFTDIGGLKVRAPVKSAGVVIGRVTDIAFDSHKYNALVTFSIGSEYKFSIDSTASILTSGLLGEQYIGLETGAEEDMAEDNDELTVQGQPAVVLEKLIGQFLFSKAAESPSK